MVSIFSVFCSVFRSLFALLYLFFLSLCCLPFDVRLLITPLVSCGHYVVCPSMYVFWLPPLVSSICSYSTFHCPTVLKYSLLFAINCTRLLTNSSEAIDFYLILSEPFSLVFLCVRILRFAMPDCTFTRSLQWHAYFVLP